MTDSEKLYNLFQDINCPNIFMCNAHELQLAEYLVANGVTFAKDTDAPSKWISVEDEKPKRRGHYFIAYKFAGSDMRFYGEAFWHDDIPDNGYVQGNHFSNEGVDGMYVTHWMKIPTPPEPPEPTGGAAE